MVLETLSSFTSTADSSIDSLGDEQVIQVHAHMDKAHAIPARAHCFIFQMDARLRSYRNQTRDLNGAMMTNAQNNGGPTLFAQTKLPEIPIPKFSG
ncbi:hypothetical protein Y032_0494g2450 [Ancylostoma ceylanicum]|uniref:Uncharacterized protein n=1 Tax=Ancylostoma ceylanicum TaxID=53326 RepID=A0A016WUD1_9BILA|nr:hypothetical protein Y032_0494g2450 [Ancylostoma ceylanicum]